MVTGQPWSQASYGHRPAMVTGQPQRSQACQKPTGQPQGSQASLIDRRPAESPQASHKGHGPASEIAGLPKAHRPATRVTGQPQRANLRCLVRSGATHRHNLRPRAGLPAAVPLKAHRPATESSQPLHREQPGPVCVWLGIGQPQRAASPCLCVAQNWNCASAPYPIESSAFFIASIMGPGPQRSTSVPGPGGGRCAFITSAVM
eukprot:352450-Chlamydomonas_euryale.AAC.1